MGKGLTRQRQHGEFGDDGTVLGGTLLGAQLYALVKTHRIVCNRIISTV